MAILKDLTVYGASRCVGDVYTGMISTISSDMGSTTITKVYCSNDNYIKWKSIASFSSDILSNINIGLYTGGSGNLTSNAAISSNGSLYLTLRVGENYFKHNIIGEGSVTVTSNSSGKITISGTNWTSNLHIGTKDTTTTSATTNNNTYLKLIENGTVRNNQIQITGSGSVSVSANASGVLTINGTDNNTDTKVTQNVSTSAKYKPIILGVQEGNLNYNFTNTTDLTYYAKTTLISPSNGLFVSQSASNGGGLKVYSYVNNISQEYISLTINTNGTASTGGAQGDQGVSLLTLGNNIARGAANTYDGANNSRGRILLYGVDQYGVNIYYNNSGVSSNRNLYIPNYNGNMYMAHVDGSDETSSITGTSINPVWVDDKGRITQSSLYRYVYDSRSGATSTYKFKKIASVTSIANASKDYWIKLSVISGFSKAKNNSGELYIRYYTASTGYYNNYTFEWTYRSMDLDPNNFIMLIKNNSNNTSTAEIWIQIPARYDGYIFKIIDSGDDRNINGKLGWVLENSTTSGGQSALPTGFNYTFYSKDANLGTPTVNIVPINTVTNQSYYILFSNNYNTTTFNNISYTYVHSNGLQYNPSTNTLTVNKLEGTATNATNSTYIAISSTNTNSTYYVTFVNGTSAKKYTYVDTDFKYNPSINVVYVGLHDNNLKWGVEHLINANSLTPISILFNDYMSGNKLAGLDPRCIQIRYTNDGTNWYDYPNTSDIQKKNLCTVVTNVTFRSGGPDGNFTQSTYSNRKLRVYIYSTPNNSGTGALLYVIIRKFHLYISTNYATPCTVTIKCATKGTMESLNCLNTVPVDAAFTTTICENQPITGWSGWNEINVPGEIITYCNDNNQFGCIMFEFNNGGIHKDYVQSTHQSLAGIRLYNILAFGTLVHGACSNIAKYNHIYTFDGDMNATFPSNVTAPTINATNITASTLITSPTFKGKVTNIMPVNITPIEDKSYYILFTPNYNSSTFNIGAYAYVHATGLEYNPYTNTLIVNKIQSATITATTFSGNATTATTATNSKKVAINTSSTNRTYYLGFYNATSSNRYTYVNANLNYNPSTNILKAGSFDGKVKVSEISHTSNISYVLLSVQDRTTSYTNISYSSLTSASKGKGLLYNTASESLHSYNFCGYVFNITYIETSPRNYYAEDHNIYIGYGHNTHTTEVQFWTSSGDIQQYLPNDIHERHLNAKINRTGLTTFGTITAVESGQGSIILRPSTNNTTDIINRIDYNKTLAFRSVNDIIEFGNWSNDHSATAESWSKNNNIIYYDTLCSYYYDYSLSGGFKYTQNLWSTNSSQTCSSASDYSKPFRGKFVCWIPKCKHGVPSLIEFSYGGIYNSTNSSWSYTRHKWVGLPMPSENLHGSIITVTGLPNDNNPFIIGVAKYSENQSAIPKDGDQGNTTNCENYFKTDYQYFIRSNNEPVRYLDNQEGYHDRIQLICTYIDCSGALGSSIHPNNYVWRVLFAGDSSY